MAVLRIEEIHELERQGALGQELVPTEYYWHWPVVDIMKLPDWAVIQVRKFGEIRWYGND